MLSGWPLRWLDEKMSSAHLSFPVRVSLADVTERRFRLGLFDLAEDLDRSIDVAVNQSCIPWRAVVIPCCVGAVC